MGTSIGRIPKQRKREQAPAGERAFQEIAP